jgi:hypothetical protein
MICLTLRQVGEGVNHKRVDRLYVQARLLIEPGKPNQNA